MGDEQGLVITFYFLTFFDELTPRLPNLCIRHAPVGDRSTIPPLVALSLNNIIMKIIVLAEIANHTSEKEAIAERNILLKHTMA